MRYNGRRPAVLIYTIVATIDYYRPAFFRTQPGQLNQPYNIHRPLSFHRDRHLPLPIYCFSKPAVEGTVGDGLDVRTRLARRLTITYNSKSSCPIFRLDAEAGIAWLFPCFELSFLTI